LTRGNGSSRVGQVRTAAKWIGYVALAVLLVAICLAWTFTFGAEAP